MNRCGEESGIYPGIRCVMNGEQPHDFHVGRENNDPIRGGVKRWPNPAFTHGPQPEKPTTKAEQELRDKAKKIPEVEKRPVDANVVPISASHPQTSHDMRDKVLPRSGTQREQVLDHIRSKGDRGAICDEVEISLDMLHQSASAAVNTLMGDGWLVDSGQRRLTRSGMEAIVWVVDDSPTRPDTTQQWVPRDFG